MKEVKKDVHVLCIEINKGETVLNFKIRI